jgi:hypothetical protein
MHILFNGCSYTWGDELENREHDRFSTLVSNYYNASHDNISKCGNSNDAISRTTMEWFNEGNVCNLAIIQWAVISRIEGYNENKNTYDTITVQIPKKWKYFYSSYYHNQLGIDTLFKNYYLLEQYFIKNKIEYFFLFHDRWDDVVSNTSSTWKKLITKNDFHFLRGNDYHDTILKSQTLDDVHFRPNEGHPNSLGHKVIADYIIDNIGHIQ